MTPVVLASGSPYRRTQLERLGLPFQTDPADIDETPRTEEPATELVQRLARAKAETVAARHPEGLVIGADQVVAAPGDPASPDDPGETLLGKPGNREAAVAQLRRLAGTPVTFHSGLCLVDIASGRWICDDIVTRVRFRPLDEARIQRYVDREPALDSAGAFKSEGLGIALVAGIDGEDPNALVGLPLIRLVDGLAMFGIVVP